MLLEVDEVAAIQASQEERCQMYPFVSSSRLGLGGGHVFTPRLLWAFSHASQASSLAGVLFGPRVQEYMDGEGDVRMCDGILGGLGVFSEIQALQYNFSYLGVFSSSFQRGFNVGNGCEKRRRPRTVTLPPHAHDRCDICEGYGG